MLIKFSHGPCESNIPDFVLWKKGKEIYKELKQFTKFRTGNVLEVVISPDTVHSRTNRAGPTLSR